MSQSVRVDICVNPVDLKGFVFLVSSTISAVALFLPPLLQGLLSLVMMDLMETSHVGLSVPRSLNLCIMYAMGLCTFPHLVQEEDSLMIFIHSFIHLFSPSFPPSFPPFLLSLSFFLTVVFCFPGSLSPKQCHGWAPSH